MTSKWTIRDTKKSDAQAIFSLIFVSWVDTLVNDEIGVTRDFLINYKIRQLTYDFYRKDCKYDHFQNTKNNLHLVAVDENEAVIGFLHCKRTNEDQELSGLYLFPEFKGAGLAQEFAEKFLQWEDVTTNTTLGVVKYNARAINFYKKLGFVPNGVNYTIADIIPCIDMVKRNVEEK